MLVGLGNPGAEYARTRHNAGFWFIDAFAEQCGARWLLDSRHHAELAKAQLQGERLLLVRPTTFMNRSGQAFSSLSNYFKIAPADVLVAHDELDLSPGTARLKFDGGHGGQNGLRDIMAVLGHGAFHRLRIGIGHPGSKDKVTPWVLGRASVDQEKAIQHAIDRSLAVMPQVVKSKLNDAMKQLHSAEPVR